MKSINLAPNFWMFAVTVESFPLATYAPMERMIHKWVYIPHLSLHLPFFTYLTNATAWHVVLIFAYHRKQASFITLYYSRPNRE